MADCGVASPAKFTASETAMSYPPILDDKGNDIRTGAPPVYRHEDPILPHERYPDVEDLPPAQAWTVLAILAAGLATFAWFVLR